MDVSPSARMCQSFCVRNADFVGSPPDGVSGAVRKSALSAWGNKSVSSHFRGSVACLALSFGVACSSIPPHPKISARSDGFSDLIAQAHLDNLVSLGPRLPGSTPDKAARGYFQREFRLAGASTEILEIGEDRHLVAEIPGRSTDTVLLMAPYPALGSDRWVDDSGAVLLLELARVLANDSPLYTVRIALADTRPTAPGASEGRGPGALRGNDGDSVLARQRVSEAGESLASALETRGWLKGLRALIAFEPRWGSASRMARDLRSHPVFRAVFWETAANLGHGDSFPPDAGWRSPLGLQGAFQARGVTQVLALVDETTARAEFQAGLGETVLARQARAAGLVPVGDVTLEALARLMRRFERADAFSQ
jgi:hypothetical protein